MSLILTRKIGETLCIGDDVKVTISGVVGNQIRLAIDAPRNIEVHREEIFLKIQEERNNRETANTSQKKGTTILKRVPLIKNLLKS